MSHSGGYVAMGRERRAPAELEPSGRLRVTRETSEIVLRNACSGCGLVLRAGDWPFCTGTPSDHTR